MKHAKIPVLMTMALLGAVDLACAQATSDVYTRSASGDVVSDQVVGSGAATVQRTADEPSGGSRQSQLNGTASADTQTLKASAELSIDSTVSGNYATAKTEASFSKEIYLDPAILGLPVGTPYALTVPIHLDGLSLAGSGTVGGSSFSYTSVDVSMKYQIKDLDQLVVVEGMSLPTKLMSFGYDARVIYDSRSDASARGGWGGSSTLTPYIEGGIADTYLFPVGSTGSLSLPMDTGPLTFDINSYVGNHLLITGNLDVFVQVEASLGRGFAAGSFENTFDAGLLGSTPGASFAGEIPGVYGIPAVPEPGTWALWLGGLAGLALRGARPRGGHAGR